MTKAKLLNIVLVCSVALNLLIAGAIVGQIAFGPHAGPPPLAWMMKDLDEETRNRLHTNFEHRRSIVAPLRKEIRAAREEFKALIIDEELDEEATHAALNRLQRASTEYTSTLHEQMVSMLKDLKPEQRLRVSRFLMRPHPRGLPRPPSETIEHRAKPAD